MELKMNDSTGERRSVLEIRDEDEGVWIRVIKRVHDYQIIVFDLNSQNEVGRVSRRRRKAAFDYARACVA
ncbi:hypothetical protein TK90_2673 (plasmid) [Thioalkalivibrio sp. K90mix]|uniref:hypothetical protein n=1 Tax=Thioalkalivibrio sp. (strain K90mix) TaxID=396595 RepID=UPI000195A3BE|nr:hypothetical protein [Thioalkalivibrio sp. K90mix]ADC73160.1 hypothetical protein TK90_2673 [Thioalkalivibrio sp. K90mix]